MDLLASPHTSELKALGLLPSIAYLARQNPWWRDLPASIQESLDYSLATARAEAMRKSAILELIGRELDRASFPCLLLKGADLAFHAYPSEGLRPMLDVDLLVPAHKLVAFGTLLWKLGFTENTSLYSRQWYLVGKCQLPPLENVAMGLALDIHGTIHPSFSPFNPSPELPWQNTLPSRWLGLRRLSTTMALWLTVCHAWIFHPAGSGARSKALVDLLAMLGDQGEDKINWAEVLHLASDTGTSFAIAHALRRLLSFEGAQWLQPLFVEATRRSQRERNWEVRKKILHQLGWIAPFVGRGQAWPPDAWRQFIKRPLRIAGQIGRRSLGKLSRSP